jgi:hypothetical protein
MSTSGWIDEKGYRISYRNLQSETGGSLTIKKDGREIVKLEGLSLHSASTPMKYVADKTRTLASLQVGKTQLLAEPQKLAEAIASYSAGKNLHEIEEALSVLGIRKKPVSGFPLSQKEITQIASSLQPAAKATITFLLKDNNEAIQQMLHWSDEVVKEYPDLDLKVLFHKNREGQVTITVFHRKDQVYPVPKASLPPASRTSSSLLLRSAVQKTVSFEDSPLPTIRANVSKGFLSLKLEEKAVTLTRLAMWKKEDVENNLPEELLEGLIEFKVGNQSLYLSTKSLLASMKATGIDMRKIEKKLASIGIKPSVVVPCKIDEKVIRHELRQAGVRDVETDQLLHFLQAHHEELTDLLSWSSENKIKIKKDPARNIPFTIRAERSLENGDETFEITLPKIGSGQDKVTKSVSLFSTEGSATLGMSRARTKEGTAKRPKEAMEKSTRALRMEIDFSKELIERGVPFIRYVEPYLSLTRQGIVTKIHHEMCPQTFSAILQQIHTLPPPQQQQAIINVVPYIACTLLALSEMHKEKICHLDFKADNLLISEDGRPRIIDFGRAIKLSEEPLATRKWLQGTPGNIALECFLYKKIEIPEAIDMFAFGILLLKVVHPLNPFMALEQRFVKESAQWKESDFIAWRDEFKHKTSVVQTIVTRHSKDESVDPIIANIDRLICDCLALDPSARPTAEEALSRVLLSEPIIATYRKMVEKERILVEQLSKPD